MKKLLLLLLLLTACAPSESSIQTALAQTQALWTPVPSQTPYSTYTPAPTIFVTKIVAPTFTPSPVGPTNTLTPTDDLPASATAFALNKLTGDKQDGFYLISVDIAPGIWRSTGTGDDCYWSVTSKTGDILDNHYGLAGGTAYISPSGFQVEFNDCGTWTYLSPP